MKILARVKCSCNGIIQLNREKRDDEDTTPKIYDIRESGAIAQDSNVVILIDRKMDDADEEVIDPKATFIIAKNRQGESNKYITVRTRLECSLFIDDNEKGQRLLQDMETAVENEGDYEVNYESNDYQQPNYEFENLEISEDDLESLFSEDDGFDNDLFGNDDSFGFDDNY